MLRQTATCVLACAILIAAMPTALAEDTSGYALGLAVSADDGDGVGVAVLGDYSFNAAASLSASFGTTRASAAPEDLETRDWFVGGRYDFGPVGVFLSGGQSGDPDDFDSDDWSAGLFHDGKTWQVSARYLRRDIDLVLRTSLSRQATEVAVPLEADGWRLAASYRRESGFRIGAVARHFDYDRDLRVLGNRFISPRLSPTTLTLATSLLDRSELVSVEWPLPGSRAFRVEAGRDELVGNLGEVDSYAIGFLTPAGDRSDLDISIGISSGDDVIDEDTVYLSIAYLFYGGFD